MWPPSEMPLATNVKPRLMPRIGISPDCTRSMLRLRAITIAAPSSP